MEKYYRIINLATLKSYNLKLDEQSANNLIVCEQSANNLIVCKDNLDLEIYEVVKVIYVKVDLTKNASENIVNTVFLNISDFEQFKHDKSIRIFDDEYQALEFIKKTYVI